MSEAPLSAPLVKPGAQVPVLDGIRGVALLMVAWFHLHYPDIRPTRFDYAVSASAAFGWAGVDLFFVLSGFLITGILLDSRDSPRYYRAFYVRRVLRIFPLYYAVLAAWHFAGPAVATRDAAEVARFYADEPWLWAYLSNVRQALAHRMTALYTTHFWSLAVEEQFYLVWPFLVRLIPRARLCAACLAGVALVVVGRAAWRAAGADPVAIYVMLPTRADALLMGAALAPWVRGPVDRALAASRARAVAAASAVALLAGIAWYAARHRILDAQKSGPFMQYGGFTLLAAFFASALLLALLAPPEGRVARLLRSRPLAFFGKYSYALYLFHYLLKGPANILFAPYVARTTGTALGSVVLLGYTAVTLATSVLLALASWRLIEAPCLRLKRHFEY